jgi:hypothetical protein
MAPSGGLFRRADRIEIGRSERGLPRSRGETRITIRLRILPIAAQSPHQLRNRTLTEMGLQLRFNRQ